MKSKKFKDLAIGDTVYMFKPTSNILPSTDKYGNVFRSEMFSKIKIRSLELYDDFIYVNGDRRTHDFSIDKTQAQETKISSKKYVADCVLFCNKEEFSDIIVTAALGAIKERENKIVSETKRLTKEIEQIRINYWEQLNLEKPIIQ